jgi:hypothetical protein
VAQSPSEHMRFFDASSAVTPIGISGGELAVRGFVIVDHLLVDLERVNLEIQVSFVITKLLMRSCKTTLR